MEVYKIIGIIFGCLGTISSICFYLTPAVPFYKILKNNLNYQGFPWILLLISFMNCILWTEYGLVCDFTLLYLANAIGANITLSFLIIYLILMTGFNCSLSLTISIGLSICIVFITCLFYFVICEDAVKIIAIIFSFLMYALFGFKIPQVIKTKNDKLILYFYIIGGIASSICWIIYGIYGICEKKWELYVSNGIDLIIVIIYLIYYLKSNCKQFDLPEKLEQFE